MNKGGNQLKLFQSNSVTKAEITSAEKVIQLKVRWKGGSAVINSKIPEFFIKRLEMEVK